MTKFDLVRGHKMRIEKPITRSRDFDPALDQYQGVGNAVVASMPLTMACWFFSRTITAAQTLMCIGDGVGGASDDWLLTLHGSAGGDPVRAVSAVNDDFSIRASTTTGYSANVWQHACGVWANATSRAAYLNGGSKGTDATARTPLGVDRFEIGRLAGFSVLELDGHICIPAVWAAALSDFEVFDLAQGKLPWLVRPQSLVGCWLADGSNIVSNLYTLSAFNAPLWADAPPQIRNIQTLPLAIIPPQSIELDLLAIIGAALAMSISPGAISIVADLLNLAGVAQAMSISPGAISTALDTLNLAAVAQDVTISPGAISTALDLLALVGVAQSATISPGSVGIDLDTLALVGAAQGAVISPGAIAIILDLLTLAGAAQNTNVSLSVIVLLSLLTLAGDAQSTSIVPGATSTILDLLTLAGDAPSVGIVPGGVTVPLDLLNMSAQALTAAIALAITRLFVTASDAAANAAGASDAAANIVESEDS